MQAGDCCWHGSLMCIHVQPCASLCNLCVLGARCISMCLTHPPVHLPANHCAAASTASLTYALAARSPAAASLHSCQHCQPYIRPSTQPSGPPLHSCQHCQPYIRPSTQPSGRTPAQLPAFSLPQQLSHRLASQQHSRLSEACSSWLA
jgi:hypothetical protein